MNNEFDKDLKQSMGNASLQEAGLSLDKDKLWGKIEKKKAKKQIAFLPWISHAAAIAAGLAIGLFLLKGHDQPLVVPDVALQMKDTSIHIIRDTVYLVKNEGEQNQHQQSSATLKKATKLQPTPGPINQQLEHIAQHDKQPEKEIQPVIVFNESVKPKVLHLTDMNNENSRPGPVAKSNFVFLKKYLKDDAQGPNPETFSMMVGKTIFNSKN